MANLSQMIDGYLAGPRALRQAVAGMTREQLRDRPVPGKWSTLEVVCHLADFDPILADRMKRVIAEDRPQLLGADEQRFAAALAYHERDLDEELVLVERTRSQMARILRTLPAEALQRVGVHNERGPLTLEQLLTVGAPAGHLHLPNTASPPCAVPVSPGSAGPRANSVKALGKLDEGNQVYYEEITSGHPGPP